MNIPFTMDFGSYIREAYPCNEFLVVYDSWISLLSDSIHDWIGIRISSPLIKTVNLFILSLGLIWITLSILKIWAGRREVQGEGLDPREGFKHNIYLPWVIKDVIAQNLRIVGEFQCIWALRIDNSERNSESYRFLGNNFLCILDRNNYRKDTFLVNFYGRDHDVNNLKGNLNDISINNDLSHLENYRRYSFNGLLTAISNMITGIDEDGEFPRDIIHEIMEYLLPSNFRELDPGTEIISVPGICDWHHDILESLIVFDGFMNAPSLRDMMGNLNERDKKDILESLISFHRVESINRSLISEDKLVYIPYRRFTVKLLERLNPRNDEILNERIGRALKLKQDYERGRSIVEWIGHLKRIFGEESTVRYLSESIREKVSREIFLYSIVLEKISVFPDNRLYLDKRRILKHIFETFRNRNIILMDHRSVEGNEGFACRYTHREDYYWGLRSYRAHFKGGDRSNKNMIKSRIDGKVPCEFESMVRFMTKGIRLYHWMDRYYPLKLDSKESLMSFDMLYETVSFWEFKVTEYLHEEDELYISYLSGEGYGIRGRDIRERNITDDSTLSRYLECVRNCLFQVHQNDWLLFCLRHLSLETSYLILDNTDPDIGTHILASKVFVRIYRIAKKHLTQEGIVVRDDISNLLDRWVRYHLPRFRWHRSVMSHVLGIIGGGDLKDIRLDPLADLDRDASLTYECSLYVRIYASLRLMRHTMQCALQMTIYSGTTLGRIDRESRKSSFLYHGDNLYPLCKVYQDSIDSARNDFTSRNPIEEGKIYDRIHRLLDAQGKVTEEHGIRAFTYISNDTGISSGNDLPGINRMDEGDLSRLTPRMGSYDWRDYDITEEFEISIES